MYTQEQIQEMVKEYEALQTSAEGRNSARYKELKTILYSKEAQVFKCPVCGKLVGFDLWEYNPYAEEYMCSFCYESALDDDI